MKIFIPLFLVVCFVAFPFAEQSAAQTGKQTKAKSAPKFPYINKWSNGRGEPVVITATTIRYGTDKPLRYRDVTKVSDGAHFNLEITTPGRRNYFARFLTLVIDADGKQSMKMMLYDTYKDMFDGTNSQGESTLYR